MGFSKQGGPRESNVGELHRDNLLMIVQNTVHRTLAVHKILQMNHLTFSNVYLMGNDTYHGFYLIHENIIISIIVWLYCTYNSA